MRKNRDKVRGIATAEAPPVGFGLGVAAILMANFIFLTDLFLPLGVAGGAPYTVLMVLGLWARNPRFLMVLAGVATALTILGALLSPPGSEAWVWTLNRGMTLLAVWAIAYLMIRFMVARTALRQTEEEARTYLEVAQVAMVALDREGDVRLINQKGCEILGREADEIVGRNWFRNFIPESIAGELEGVFRQLIAGEGEPLEYYENPVRTAEGGEKIIAWYNAVLRDGTGRITGTLSSGEDVTDRRRAEEKMRKRESLAKLGQMAAVVAHEVRNPLAGIAGAIQILGGRLATKKDDREVIDSILKRLDSLGQMSHELLQFARPREPRFEPIRLRALLQSVADHLVQDPDWRRLRVEIQGPDLSIEGDPELLKTVFQNLLLNAAHAVDGTGRILVTLGSRNGEYRVAIQDHGPGVPADLRDRIFEPFFTTRHRGTGLGLAIARKVVEGHGGEINVEPTPGGGATFLIDFPEGMD